MARFKPSELLIIGGAAIGAFLVGNNGKSIKKTLKALPKLMRGSKYNKALYMDLMALLSSLNGYAPQIAVEFGRKTLYSTERPSFSELEEHVRNAKNPAKQTSDENA